MIDALSRAESTALAFLAREMAPSTARWHTAIRALVTSIAILVTMQVFRLSEGYWAIITMLLVGAPGVTSSFRGGVQRIVSTTLGVAVAYTLYATLFEQPWFLIPAIFTCITIAALVIVRSGIPAVGWVFALSVLVVIGDSHRSFDSIATIAFEREWVVAIGVGLTWIGARMLFPVHPLLAIRTRLGQALDRTRTRMAFIRAQLSPDNGRADVSTLSPPVGPQEIQALLLLIQTLLDERPSFRATIDQLTDRVMLLESISELSSSAIGALKCCDESKEYGGFVGPVTEVVSALEVLLGDLQAWTNQLDPEGEGLNRVPLDFTALDRAIQSLGAAHEAHIARAGIRNAGGAQLEGELERTVRSVLPITAVIAMVRTLRASSYAASIRALPGSQDGASWRAWIVRPRFGLGLRRDASRGLSFAIRTAIACTIGWIFVTATGYASLTTMMVTPLMIVGVSGGSMEATVARARLRFLGGFAGGAIGILALIFVMPTITTLTGLIVLWAVCAAPFLWVYAGGPRVSYFGVQGLFCLAIVMLGSFAPTINMTPLSARVTGILLGALVTYLVFGVISPEPGRRELFEIATSALRRIGAILRARLLGPTTGLAELHQLRFRSYALILRMQDLAAHLRATPPMEAPGLTPDQVARVEVQLCRLVATAGALTTNRLTGVLSDGALSELSEIVSCTEAIECACDALADNIDSQRFDCFADALEPVDRAVNQLSEQTAQLRLRPRVRALDAAAAERVLGQIALCNLAHARLHELVAVFADIRAENQRFRASQQRYLPARFVPSSTV